MRNIIFGFVYLCILLVGFFIWLNRPAAPRMNEQPGGCEEPLTYRIGEVDAGFNIGKADVKRIMSEVEELWTDAAGKKIIRHSSNGDIGINLVYGDEQQFMVNEKTFADQVEDKKREYESLEREYDRLYRRHKRMLDQYHATLDEYESRVERHNSYVEELSGKGSLSDRERQNLATREKQLDEFKRNLDRQLNEVEELRETVKEKADALKTLSEEQSELVAQYNDQFAGRKEFHQGSYTRKNREEMINIFQFTTLNNLRLVLAHEVGHALGLDHVANPRSIMFYRMEEQNMADLQFSGEDLEAIRMECGEKEEMSSR